jgi:hypothetical protein
MIIKSTVLWMAGFAILALTTPTSGFAQNVTLSLASGSGSPGGTVTLNISLNATSGNQPSAVQWILSFSTPDFSSIGVVAGSAATAAGKVVSCGSGVGTSTCAVWGMNSTAIQNGVVATVTLTLSASTVNTSSSIQLTGGQAASAAGSAVSTAAIGGTVIIVQPTPPSLTGVSCAPASVSGGQPSTCTVTLSKNALAGGFVASISDNVPSSVSVPTLLTFPGGAISATFAASTFATGTTTPVTITATAGGLNVSTILTTLSSSACTYTLAPGNRSYSAGGGSANVGVTAGAGCGWTATTDSPTWITLQTGAVSGNGNGSFVYSVTLNLGLARLGTITIGNQSFKVMEGGSVSVQPFTDVSPVAPDFDYISLMSSYGITAGCSANPPLYCPSTPVDRQQMAVFVVAALDHVNHAADALPPIYTVSPAYFQDEPVSDSVYYPFVQRLADMAITNGCQTSPPLFCPATSITQGQMAKFMILGWLHANNLSSFSFTPTPYFTDVPATDMFFSYIQKMRDLGFWPGCGGNQYCESSAVLRADMAPMVMRALLGAP